MLIKLKYRNLLSFNNILENLHRFPLLTHSPSKPTALHINLLIPFHYIPLVNIPVGLQKNNTILANQCRRHIIQGKLREPNGRSYSLTNRHKNNYDYQ